MQTTPETHEPLGELPSHIRARLARLARQERFEREAAARGMTVQEVMRDHGLWPEYLPLSQCQQAMGRVYWEAEERRVSVDQVLEEFRARDRARWLRLQAGKPERTPMERFDDWLVFLLLAAAFVGPLVVLGWAMLGD